MSDLISRQDVIEKLRKHKMLFCKNRVEYSALSKDEKARVDEIDNCIAELVNMPSSEPERVKVISVDKPIEGSDRTIHVTSCENCERVVGIFDDYCPGCGARLEWE